MTPVLVFLLRGWLIELQFVPLFNKKDSQESADQWIGGCEICRRMSTQPTTLLPSSQGADHVGHIDPTNPSAFKIFTPIGSPHPA